MKILITADWHIRGERPLCRLDDDWIDSQRKTIAEIRNIFAEEMCYEMWILGDLFDAPKCSTAAVNMLIDELKKFKWDTVKILCGNHDLKDHNYDNLEQCSIGTLLKIFGEVPNRLAGLNINKPTTISATPFGRDDEESHCDVICTHQLTFPDEKSRPMPGRGALAQELLDKWKHSKAVFTGDYHHSFIYRNGSRFVMNPGCINIQKADELDYCPSVYIWDSWDDTIHQRFLNPQSKNCTRDHIEAREQKEEMLSEVVETIAGGTEMTLDFDSNLDAQVRKTSSAIIDEYETMRQGINEER